MLADTGATAPAEEPENRGARLVIENALSVLSGKGRIEEIDDELIVTLKRIYDENPLFQVEVTSHGNVLAGSRGEYLAGAYERECEERWEREEAPRWSCPCGHAFGVYEWRGPHTQFYTLTDDGLFQEPVAACPSCTRNLAKVREEHADGQLGFAF